MKERFEGADGRRLRVEAFQAQKMLRGNAMLAEEIADRVELVELTAGQTLIDQDGTSNDIFFIISGVFGVVVNGKQVAARGPGDHVGEMAAIQPTQRRSANVIAIEEAVVARLSEADFSEIADRYPGLYKGIAQELARRLLERNKLLSTYRDKIRIFIISSAESLEIARAIQVAFEHDPFICTIWTDGVFKVANYTLQSLEDASTATGR